MKIYKSRNSRYYFDDGSIIRENGNRRTNLGKEIVYASKESIESLLKKYDIKIRKTSTIDFRKGDKLLDELMERAMDKKEKGGRFFVLRENGISKEYSIFCSGEIIEIEDEEPKLKIAE